MSETALVKTDPYVLMDRLDDTAIIKELKGEDPKVLVYSFQQGGKKVESLSKRGAFWALNRMAENGEIVRLENPVVVDRDDESISISIMARRYRRDQSGNEIELNNSIGSKRQAKKMRIKDGRGGYKNEDDPFFFEKAVSKAARNAIFNFLPQTLLVQMINDAKGIKDAVHELKEGEFVDADFAEEIWEPITDDAISKIRDLHIKLGDVAGKEVADAFYKATKLSFQDADGKPLYSIEKASLQGGREIYRILSGKINANQDVK